MLVQTWERQLRNGKQVEFEAAAAAWETAEYLNIWDPRIPRPCLVGDAYST
jgi:antirestriction protein ArdC